jgi:hypothetical protein
MAYYCAIYTLNKKPVGHNSLVYLLLSARYHVLGWGGGEGRAREEGKVKRKEGRKQIITRENRRTGRTVTKISGLIR